MNRIHLRKLLWVAAYARVLDDGRSGAEFCCTSFVLSSLKLTREQLPNDIDLVWDTKPYACFKHVASINSEYTDDEACEIEYPVLIDGEVTDTYTHAEYFIRENGPIYFHFEPR